MSEKQSENGNAQQAGHTPLRYRVKVTLEGPPGRTLDEYTEGLPAGAKIEDGERLFERFHRVAVTEADCKALAEALEGLLDGLHAPETYDEAVSRARTALARAKGRE